MVTTTIKLTKGEVDLIMHRFVMPECLADVFEEEFENNSAFEEAFWVAHDEVGKMLKRGELTIESPEQAEVVKECCNGSTWVASGYDRNGDNPKYPADCRVARSLEKKLAGVGIEVRVPRS